MQYTHIKTVIEDVGKHFPCDKCLLVGLKLNSFLLKYVELSFNF